ncbi:uncharacterized protein V6R79_026381 [Siganus canaliculatus]
MENGLSGGPYFSLKQNTPMSSEVCWTTDILQEEELLSELQELELQRLQSYLCQKLLKDFPPIPLRWLRSADAHNTAKTMVECYSHDGALLMLDAALKKIGRDDLVLKISPNVHPPSLRLASKPDPHFLKTWRRRLISWVQWPDAIMDDLQNREVLKTINMDAISIFGVRKDKNRALVDLLLRKGDEAQKAFYEALSHSEPFLLQELETHSLLYKCSAETFDLTDMLEFLVSDELRAFQWLLSDYMIGQSIVELQQADRHATQELLEKHFGHEQAESVAMKILLKIVPALSFCLSSKAMTSQPSCDGSEELTVVTTVTETSLEVFEAGIMFRHHSLYPGVFQCGLTGLVLEGCGDVVYHTVSWDVNFLASKGFRPGGPLFRFKLLTGSFQRLHLPHHLLVPGELKDVLSVAHITEENLDFMKPDKVTDSHVIINISGFSCFGLVMSRPQAAESNFAISGLVLLFYRQTDHSLFVLLQPSNICLKEVIKQLKKRMNAVYVETVPDCELVPNQTYKLCGSSNVLIQPEISKFKNYSNYENFLPSFHVVLPPGVWKVELQLKHLTPRPLIGWLFGSLASSVWQQIVDLRAADSVLSAEACVPETVDTGLLLNTLNNLNSNDFEAFKRYLSWQPDPISKCKLEAADRSKTVDIMVQKYQTERAMEVTEEILRKMNCNQLANGLSRS